MTRLLEWKAEYALGVPGVDHEHRELIGLINEVYRRLERPEDGAAVELLLGDIYAAIAAHFALEEQEMRAAAYAEYEDHKADHEALLDQIVTLMDRFADDPAARVDEIRARLDDWFMVHFGTFDARLHKWL